MIRARLQSIGVVPFRVVVCNRYSTRTKHAFRSGRSGVRRPAPARSVAPTSPKPAETTEELPRMAFADEIEAIFEHSTLLNQTTALQILDLEDIRPMMALYASLPSPELTNMVVQKVVGSLKQTAKDASYIFRSLPQDERVLQQESVHQALREYLDQVALDVVNGKVKDTAAISQLFRAYEMVDPLAAVVFHENMPQRALWGGAVIPSLIKVNAAFDDIRTVFEQAAKAAGGLEYLKPQAVANMTLACVRYGQIEAAEALFNGLMSEEAGISESLRQYLIDIFVGDAPVALGLSTFLRYPTHAPHHSAMSRLLNGIWEANQDVDEQISVFSDYLSRLSVPNELGIKPVALVVVQNIIGAQPTPEEATLPIVHLCNAYGAKVRHHELLLNIILREVSQRWTKPDEARDLVLGIINNYDLNGGSVVSYRVRLNALENLTNVEDLVAQLWHSRKLGSSLQKFDWFALLRATRHGAYFKDEWIDAGEPFRQDISRFAISRRYR